MKPGTIWLVCSQILSHKTPRILDSIPFPRHLSNFKWPIQVDALCDRCAITELEMATAGILKEVCDAKVKEIAYVEGPVVEFIKELG